MSQSDYEKEIRRLEEKQRQLVFWLRWAIIAVVLALASMGCFLYSDWWRP